MSLASLLKGQLSYMSEHYEIIGVSGSGDGHLEDIGLMENVKVLPVEMTRKITPIKDLVAVYKLYKILAKF